MERLFVETTIFQKTLDNLKLKELEKVIKDEILKDPAAGDVVQGTGGIRKIRIAKPGQQGKSGGYRVLYLDLPNVEVIYLFLVFDKSVMGNIPAAQKKVIKAMVEELKNEWNKSN